MLCMDSWVDRSSRCGYGSHWVVWPCTLVSCHELSGCTAASCFIKLSLILPVFAGLPLAHWSIHLSGKTRLWNVTNSFSAAPWSSPSFFQQSSFCMSGEFARDVPVKWRIERRGEAFAMAFALAFRQSKWKQKLDNSKPESIQRSTLIGFRLATIRLSWSIRFDPVLICHSTCHYLLVVSVVSESPPSSKFAQKWWHNPASICSDTTTTTDSASDSASDWASESILKRRKREKKRKKARRDLGSMSMNPIASRPIR